MLDAGRGWSVNPYAFPESELEALLGKGNVKLT